MENKILKYILREGSPFYLLCDDKKRLFKKMFIPFDGFVGLLEIENKDGETIYFPLSEQEDNLVVKTKNGYKFHLYDEQGCNWTCFTNINDI